MATQYSNGKIITSGLVLSLNAADPNSYVSGSTTWNDMSGNGYNHGLYGSYAFTNFQGVPCFNFTTTGVALPLSSTYTFNGIYTMVAWANALSDAQVSNWRTLWRTSPNDHPLLISDGSDLMGYYDNAGSGFVSYGSTLGSLANKWTMFTIVGTGVTNTLYYNNANLVGSVVFGAPHTNSHNAIGSDPSGTQPFGYVASATIYNRSLSTSEILQNYNAQKSRFNL
jgi:hypothetical protein